MSLYMGYEPAGPVCTGGPTPGAKALVEWWLNHHATQGARNDGIYNCRHIAGTGTPSLHGEGRAADLGTPPLAAFATTTAEQLKTNSKQLGIQCVIWDRRIWSGAKPNAGWRRYNGADPHNRHLHVELARAAATGPNHLTAARLNHHLNPPPPKPPERPEMLSPEDKTWIRNELAAALKDIDKTVWDRLINRTPLPDGTQPPPVKAWWMQSKTQQDVAELLAKLEDKA
jgi:hypothetical protein